MELGPFLVLCGLLLQDHQHLMLEAMAHDPLYGLIRQADQMLEAVARNPHFRLPLLVLHEVMAVPSRFLIK